MAYGWIINRDHLSQQNKSIIGPSELDGTDEGHDLIERLTNGEGAEFRIYDDDGYLYYSGRCIVEGEDGVTFSGGSEEWFGPLWDFGEPGAGATEIRYKDEQGEWKTL